MLLEPTGAGAMAEAPMPVAGSCGRAHHAHAAATDACCRRTSFMSSREINAHVVRVYDLEEHPSATVDGRLSIRAFVGFPPEVDPHSP